MIIPLLASSLIAPAAAISGVSKLGGGRDKKGDKPESLKKSQKRLAQENVERIDEIQKEQRKFHGLSPAELRQQMATSQEAAGAALQQMPTLLPGADPAELARRRSLLAEGLGQAAGTASAQGQQISAAKHEARMGALANEEMQRRGQVDAVIAARHQRTMDYLNLLLGIAPAGAQATGQAIEAGAAAGAGTEGAAAAGAGTAGAGAAGAGAAAACWVAEELFGANDPYTHFARYYCYTHDNWFVQLYSRHGERWAAWLHRHRWARPIVRPIWVTMAMAGARTLREVSHG